VLAVLIALSLHSGYCAWRIEKVLPFSLKGWMMTIALEPFFCRYYGFGHRWP